MILHLIRYSRGYIDVKFSGVRSEQILSNLNSEKVSVWNLKYQSGTIVCRMAAKDFARIRKIRKGTGVKVSIKGRHGLPFFTEKYRRRAGLIAGAVIFFAILKFLSGYIWVINIEGNVNVAPTNILKSLKEIGIYENMKANELDPKNNAQALLLLRDDLAWASLNIEGSVLTVNVREIEKRIDDENPAPTNLIAATDGIVKKIDAVSGNVIVKVGDSVHKGDILVSGIIENLSSTVFVDSNAEVTAQVLKTYSETENFKRVIKHSTGDTQRRRVIEFFGIRIPLFLKLKNKTADVSLSRDKLQIFGNKIPVTIYTETRDGYTDEQIVLSREQVIDSLSKKLNDYITKTEINGYIPISTEYIADSDGITVFHKYLCDENIAKKSKIITAQ